MNDIEVESVTIQDLYILMHTSHDKLLQSINNLQKDVTSLNQYVGNIADRVVLCEERIAKMEDNIDDRLREQQIALSSVQTQEFPVDTTLVCYGIPYVEGEDIYETAQVLVETGLDLPNIQVQLAKRMSTRNNRPGLVKIQLSSLDDKIAVLRAKRNLLDTEYCEVYIRSSMSHADRMAQNNLHIILNEIPNGYKYRVAANGRIIKKDRLGSSGDGRRRR